MIRPFVVTMGSDLSLFVAEYNWYYRSITGRATLQIQILPSTTNKYKKEAYARNSNLCRGFYLDGTACM